MRFPTDKIKNALSAELGWDALTLQERALPSAQVRRRLVGTLRKLKERGIRMGGATTREPRVGEIEAPPPEVHGARLAEEAGAERIEDPPDPDEYLQERLCRSRVVGAMDRVGFEANRAGDFGRHGPDPGVDAQP